jgi:hypothetical protein
VPGTMRLWRLARRMAGRRSDKAEAKR